MAVNERRAQELLAEAGMLKVASELVRDEPDDGRIRELAESGLFDEAPEGFEDEALSAGFALLREGLAKAAADTSGAEVAALKREWLRLFAGIGEPQVPSWANYYLDPESRVLGRESLAARSMYASYGLELVRKGSEPDDDLGLMLRFLAHLAELEVTGADTAADRAELLREHILPWISAWRYAGLKFAESDFYRGAVEFTFGLVRACAASLGFSYHDDTRSFATKG
jgi:TorA maturation chaperone TorD